MNLCQSWVGATTTLRWFAGGFREKPVVITGTLAVSGINEEGLTGSLATGDESPAQMIARLTRELQHVTEQCRVAHVMAMHWKARVLVAEDQVRRLQPKADRGRDPGVAPRATRAVGDGLHDHLGLLEQWQDNRHE